MDKSALSRHHALAVLHAYEGSRDQGHSAAFGIALGLYRALRGDMPAAAAADDVALLLATGARPAAPYVFCE